MPQSFPHRPAGPPAPGAHRTPRRWAPNIPGRLTRSLTRCLGVDAGGAMRIALLYGDMEWQAGGAALLRYSASDYARRQGLHRQTVHADIRRLQGIGAITVRYDRCSQAVLELHGLGCLESLPAEGAWPAAATTEQPDEVELEPSLAGSFHPIQVGDCIQARHRARRSHHHPCRLDHQPPGDAIDPTLSVRPPALEKGLKTQDKRREEKNSQPLPPPRPMAMAADPEPSGDPAKPVLSAWPCVDPEHDPTAGRVRSSEQEADSQRRQPAAKAAGPSRLACELKTQSQTATAALLAAEMSPRGVADRRALDLDALLAELLDTFRSAAPSEWPRPRRLTLTAGRRSRLRACLAHAGSHPALLEQLRLALAQVPPWFRRTYPVRPDGSRRPSHQFFDLLFRASAGDRDGGPEAWPVFAWSEADAPEPAAAPAGREALQPPGSGVRPAVPVQGPRTGALTAGGESEQQRAQRLFGWGGSSWLLRDIEALQIPLAERRRLTGLLESEGQGIAGAGAIQFADASAPTTTASQPATTPEPAGAPVPSKPSEPSELLEPTERPAAPLSRPAPSTPKGRHRPCGADRHEGRPTAAGDARWPGEPCAALLDRP